MTDNALGGPAAHHIALLLHSLDGGGAQRRTIALAKAFAAAGRRVDVVAPVGGALADLADTPVRTIVLGAGVDALVRYLTEETPNLLLVGSVAAHAIGVRAHERVPTIPLILRASSHPFRPVRWTTPINRIREILRRRNRARRYAAADAVVAVAEAVAFGVRALAPGAKVTVIANSVIDAAFLAGAQRAIVWPWFDDCAPLIVAVGRITEAKDYATLLRAFALLRGERVARLAIIGDGDPSPLERLSARLGITGEVAFPGPSDAIAAWLKRAKLFVSSSLWEGSPGAVIEALAMGCPVVATDAPGGSRELLGGGAAGRLVPLRDPTAMAAAMRSELDRPTEPALLKRASAPYRDQGQAGAYLAVIDATVRRVRKAD